MIQELYTTLPEHFVQVRTRLSQEASSRGDRDLARAITAARKPTLAAWIANVQAHAEPAGVEQLLDVGVRLRAAHEDLDASALRALSDERRCAVSELTDAALARAGRTDPGAPLRAEVSGTFDAAVADPRIAARLGRLSRPERWSGFGVAVDPKGPPELTVVRGGRARPAEDRVGNTDSPRGTRRAPDAGRGERATARRRRAHAREKAERDLAQAEQAVVDCEQAERAARQRVDELDDRLRELQSDLEQATRAHDDARRTITSARKRRREARSAVERAQRREQ